MSAVAELNKLPSETPSMVLHAWLFRYCHSVRVALVNETRGKGASEFMAVGRSQIHAEPAKAVDYVRTGPRQNFTLRAAAALLALDELHQADRTSCEGRLVRLPIDDTEMLFLPAPPTPVATSIPPGKSLSRSRAHGECDIVTELKLFWRLILVGGIRPRWVRLSREVEIELEVCKTKGLDLRVGLCSPFADAEYLIEGCPDNCHPDLGVPFRFMGMVANNRSAASASLHELLDRAVAQRVDILCFPELTLDQHLRGELRQWLRYKNPASGPRLVVEGGFHTDSASGSGFVNRCEVLDGRGETLWIHEKMVPFAIPAADAEKMDSETLAGMGIDRRGGYEGIRLSDEFPLADTPLGRVATPICLDFCGRHLDPFIEECGVTMLLVPAMTVSTEAFMERARGLGTRNRAATFVVNSAWILRKTHRERENVGIAYLPARDATRCWRVGEGDALTVVSLRDVLAGPTPP